MPNFPKTEMERAQNIKTLFTKNKYPSLNFLNTTNQT